MKRTTLIGFSAYILFNDGTLKTASDNKKVKVTKGSVTLTASEDYPEGGIVAGTKYTYATADLLASIPEQNWVEDAPAADAPAAPAVELTAEQIEKNRLKAERKVLKDAVDAGLKKVIAAATDEDTLSAKTEMKNAQDALDAWDEENKPKPSEAQLTAEANLTAEEEAMAEFQVEYEVRKESYLKALAAVREFHSHKSILTAGTGATGDVPQRAPHLNYETAQNIRKDVSEGMTHAAAAEKYGCSASSVGFIVVYEHYKLKEGDTAFTPLINARFPEGAPFAKVAAKA